MSDNRYHYKYAVVLSTKRGYFFFIDHQRYEDFVSTNCARTYDLRTAKRVAATFKRRGYVVCPYGGVIEDTEIKHRSFFIKENSGGREFVEVDSVFIINVNKKNERFISSRLNKDFEWIRGVDTK